MGPAAKPTRHNRTISVDFQDEVTYFQLLGDTKAFVEFVLAFILSLGFQLLHKASCQFLAQTTHPHTPAKQGGKACLERGCEWVKG